jgi:hypothetical protein
LVSANPHLQSPKSTKPEKVERRLSETALWDRQECLIDTRAAVEEANGACGVENGSSSISFGQSGKERLSAID